MSSNSYDHRGRVNSTTWLCDMEKSGSSSSNENSKNCYRGHWRPAEDDKLKQLVQQFGPQNWNFIAEHLQGRSGKSCRLRWYNQLDPNINKKPFTEEEEEKLLAAHRIYGNKWACISKYFQGRTDNSVKNHFHVVMARRRRERFTLNHNTPPNYNNQDSIIKSPKLGFQNFQSHQNKGNFGIFSSNSSLTKNSKLSLNIVGEGKNGHDCDRKHDHMGLGLGLGSNSGSSSSSLLHSLSLNYLRHACNYQNYMAPKTGSKICSTPVNKDNFSKSYRFFDNSGDSCDDDEASKSKWPKLMDSEEADKEKETSFIDFLGVGIS